MNIIAFLIAVVGAALNMFKSVIDVPVSTTAFTGSMYDAFIAITNNIEANGLSSLSGSAIPILVFAVLFIVPIAAIFAGLYILLSTMKCIRRFSARKMLSSARMLLLLCAVVNGVVAWRIYYVSSESLSSFLTDIIPYAQEISFINPAIWAVLYLVAAILIRKPSIKPIPYSYQTKYPDTSKAVSLEGPLLYEIGWTNDSKHICDLDASAFIFDIDGHFLAKKDMIYHGNKKYKAGSLILSPDMVDGGEEHITVKLHKIPQRVGTIFFAATIHDGEQRRQKFGSTLSAYAKLVDQASNWEPVNYNLRDDERFSNKTAVIVAEIHRNAAGGWNYRAIGDAMNGGLDAVRGILFDNV